MMMIRSRCTVDDFCVFCFQRVYYAGVNVVILMLVSVINCDDDEGK